MPNLKSKWLKKLAEEEDQKTITAKEIRDKYKQCKSNVCQTFKRYGIEPCDYVEAGKTKAGLYSVDQIRKAYYRSLGLYVFF